MLKRLMNWIRREDEIKRLKRDVQCLHILLNRLDETTRFELSRINHAVIAVQAREEILVDEVIRLQERNIYEQ